MQRAAPDNLSLPQTIHHRWPLFTGGLTGTWMHGDGLSATASTEGVHGICTP